MIWFPLLCSLCLRLDTIALAVSHHILSEFTPPAVYKTYIHLVILCVCTSLSNSHNPRYTTLRTMLFASQQCSTLRSFPPALSSSPSKQLLCCSILSSTTLGPSHTCWGLKRGPEQGFRLLSTTLECFLTYYPLKWFLRWFGRLFYDLWELLGENSCW